VELNEGKENLLVFYTLNYEQIGFDIRRFVRIKKRS
jgi:hypothetical protein